MKKSEITKMVIVFLALLGVAIGMDMTQKGNVKSGAIARDEVGSDTRKVSLVVEPSGWQEKLLYELEVEPQKVTEEQAKAYFEKVIEMIDTAFLGDWEDPPIEEGYLEGLVQANWRFSPSGYLSSDGVLLEQNIPKEGVLITAFVTMECGEYEQVYSFSFRLMEKELSEEETLRQALEEWFETQQTIEGSDSLILPEEILGVSLQWSEKKDYLWGKVLCLELFSIVLMFWCDKKRQEKEIAEHRREAELQYVELAGWLQVLLEAGMTTRQAWESIANQYNLKRKRHLVQEKYVYEAVLHMVRRFQEGESERKVYQNFLKEVDVLCYRRLIRILLGNLEKGNRDISKYLKEETQQAFEQRVLLAKRLGEEASTKMLVPLMLMMTLVMGIVMIPAIMSFSI